MNNTTQTSQIIVTPSLKNQNRAKINQENKIPLMGWPLIYGIQTFRPVYKKKKLQFCLTTKSYGLFLQI